MSFFKKLFGKSDDKTSNQTPKSFSSTQQTKQDFNNFADLLNQHAALSMEKQVNFNEVTGGKAWNIDLHTATLSFGDIHFKFEVIGSLSFNDYSWMWGWANAKSGIPQNLLGSSLKLKAIGEQKDIDQFTNGHFSVEEGFEHQMGMVACGLLNADAYFCANYGQGTMVITTKSKAIPSIDKNDLSKIITIFPQVISGLPVNHKAAFKNYLIDRGVAYKESNHQIEGKLNGKGVTAEFDEQSRMINLKGTL